MMWLIDLLSHQGPNICRSWLFASPYREHYEAFVCGISLPPSASKQWLTDTGLIHLMVVSGAHLHFVERGLGWFPVPLRLSALVWYSWLTGWGAPVVRALCRRLCVEAIRPWGWTPLQVEFLATLALLVVHPQWLWSRSFLMSWMCALALQLPRPRGRWYGLRWLDVSLKCYVLLFVFVPSSPFTMAWNALVGPLIGALLFPVTVMVVIWPAFQVIGDGLWWIFFTLLEHGPKPEPVVGSLPTTSIFWVPLFLHLALLYLEVKWRRAWAFS